MENKSLSIYLHIPFCKQKCHYCDFVSHKAEQGEIASYVQNLVTSIEQESLSYINRTIETVFFGGGTPSLLSLEQITSVMRSLYKNFQMETCKEITIEVNPATVNEEQLRGYLQLGINRLSIGLQSTHNNELQLLGRIHTYEEFLETYTLARKVGFTNINIDLMAAIPGQTFESFAETLERICALEPEHVSAYSLIIEEHTLFYEKYKEPLFEEEEERKLYEYTKEYLRSKGYERYEISNYAKNGYECKHNNCYWQRKPYLGIGVAAASMVDNVRWSTGEERLQLTVEEQMEEFMFLGMRRMAGISVQEFEEEFGVTLEEVYGCVLEKLIKEGLVEQVEGMVRLTDRGIDISNYVFAEFLLD